MFKSVKKWLVPVLLATILTAGAFVAWAIACGVTASVAYQLFWEARPPSKLVFTLDGQPILESSERPGIVTYTTYRTLNGRLIDEPVRYKLQNKSYWNTELPGPRARLAEHLAWRQRIRGCRGPQAYWYLIQDSESLELAYFVGFDAITKYRVGYLGLKGFRSEVPGVDERFVVTHRWSDEGSFEPVLRSSFGSEPRNVGADEAVFLVSGHSLYRVDLRQQTVTQIPMPDPVISVGTVAEPTAVADERHAVYKERLVVRFADRLAVLDFDGDTLQQIALPTEIREFDFTLYDTTGDDWLAVRNAGGGSSLPTDIYWIDKNGRLARHEQIDLSAGQGRRASAWPVAVIVPMPLPLAITSLVAQPFNLQSEALSRAGLVDEVKPLDFEAALAESLAQMWLPLVVVCLVSLAAAIVCYRHQRRAVGSGAVVWAVFVFLAGVPGLVGYLLHRRWPVYETCAACGAMAPRDQAACLACAREFPVPPPRGIEIFV